MNKIKEWWSGLNIVKKYSISNPASFEETWSFTATKIQLFSLIALLSILFGILFTVLMLKGPFAEYFSKNDTSIERVKLEQQLTEINKLKNKLDQQEYYLQNVRKVISGEIIEDTTSQNIPEIKELNANEINSETSESEKLLAEKVKSDLRTVVKKRPVNLPFFVSPVDGVISQDFNLNNHLGVDIVTPKDMNVKACLAGTVLFSGYTQKDGNVIVLDHPNGFVSIYKHNKTILKKVGAKVQLNDPIAIVGNTGENFTQSHLHFELWYNQNCINPTKYIRF